MTIPWEFFASFSHGYNLRFRRGSSLIHGHNPGTRRGGVFHRGGGGFLFRGNHPGAGRGSIQGTGYRHHLRQPGGGQTETKQKQRQEEKLFVHGRILSPIYENFDP